MSRVIPAGLTVFSFRGTSPAIYNEVYYPFIRDDLEKASAELAEQATRMELHQKLRSCCHSY